MHTLTHPTAFDILFIPANRITYKLPYTTAMMLQMSESKAPTDVRVSEEA
jgi:hypothetical protein